MPIRAGAKSAALVAAYVETRRHPHARWESGRALEALCVWLAERRIRDLRQVREAELVSFFSSLSTTTNRRGRPFSDGQRQDWLGVLRGFFRFLEERRHIFVSPAREIRLPRAARQPPRVLSEAQARRLMAAPFSGSSLGLRDRAILETLYGTGLRLGECVRLDLQDVSLAESRILVRSGKGKKDRIVPIVGAAAAALDVYLRDVRPLLAKWAREQAVFLSHRGNRLSSTAIQARLALYGRQIGLRVKMRPHLLRHTCATHLLQGGADIRHVQRLLGHRDLRTTAIYTHLDTSDLRRMLERSHPRERRRGATK